jgi:hypothetical protein
MFDYYVYGFNITLIIINTFIAMVIALLLAKTHEVIHYVVAKKMGYKINGFKLWKNEVDVDIKPDDPNFKKIARAPYYVLIPVGALLVIWGVLMYPGEYFLGILVAGVTILFLHCLSFPFEGKDIKKKMLQEETVEEV